MALCDLILNVMMCLLLSILNKLTPEKFDKLCLDLLNAGIESKTVLKGIILLVRIHSSSSLD